MTATATESKDKTLRLDLEGMTCASCAARIEKRLNKLDGVDATVNVATEQATMHCADTFASPPDILTQIESLAFKILDEHVRHCVAGALTSGDSEVALEKTEELLAAVQRFARTR